MGGNPGEAMGETDEVDDALEEEVWLGADLGTVLTAAYFPEGFERRD